MKKSAEVPPKAPIYQVPGCRMDETGFHYASRGSSEVTIPRVFDAFGTLGLSRAHCTFSDAKTAFAAAICNPDRQVRARVALAYDIVGCYLDGKLTGASGDYVDCGESGFTYSPHNHFFLATIGARQALEFHYSRKATAADKEACNAWGASPLYIVARAGYIDCVCMLYRLGVNLESRQQNGSTALHAASYFGHGPVVSHLLAYGVNPNIKNKMGNTAESEAKTDAIAQAFTTVMGLDGTGLQRVRSLLRDAGPLVPELSAIRLPGEGSIVAFRAQHPHFDAVGTRGWLQTWHGTKLCALPSILEYGLRPAGSKIARKDGTTAKVSVRSGHIKRGVELSGVEDWAAAVFVSPSISYAAHPAYAEQIQFSDGAFCVLLDVRTRPGSYTTTASTLYVDDAAKVLAGEPSDPEMRVAGCGLTSVSELEAPGDAMIHRVSDRSNVEVAAIVFIKLSFIENTRMTLLELNTLLTEGEQRE